MTSHRRVVGLADARATSHDPGDCPVCGRDACDDPAHVPPSRPRLVWQTAGELIAAPRPVEIVEGIAWAGCVTLLVSEAGAGKTYVMLSLAAHVADDLDWMGRPVRHGSVAYLSYEGDALGVRLRALRDVGGHRLEHLHVVRAHDPISPRVGRDGSEDYSIGEIAVTEALAELQERLARMGCPPIRLVVIDTARASMAGTEDSSEHVSAYLRAVRRIMTTVPEAACIPTHHAGWQDGEARRRRARGSSAWRGGTEGELYLESGPYDRERGEAELRLTPAKVRDGELWAPLHLVRRRVEIIEPDERGDPVTACIIARDTRTNEDRARERQAVQAAATSERQRALAVEALRVIRDHRITSQVALHDYLRPRRRPDVQDALAGLLRAGHVIRPERQREPYRLSTAGEELLRDE